MDITYSDEEVKTLKERIEADPDDLVKYCLLESTWNFLDKDIQNPQTFFNLVHAARLAKVRRLKGGGDKVVSLITYAVENLLEQKKSLRNGVV